MLRCPHCTSVLGRQATPAGVIYPCPGGHGEAVTLTVLRQLVGPATVGALWSAARRPDADLGVPCPACRRPTNAVWLAVGEVAVEVDVCPRCWLVWLDDGEQVTLAPTAVQRGVPAHDDIPEPAREILARARLEAAHDRLYPRGPTPTWGQIALALLGMPVEHNPEARRGTPIVTLTLTAVVVAASLAAMFSDLQGAALRWGLIPADWTADGGLRLLSYFFVHGGLFHLVGNMYFLVVFGDDVERFLGPLRYLALLALGTVAGGLAHVALDPSSEIPLVGASAGISAVLVFYVLRFPRARLGLLWWFMFVWIPARVFAAFWVAQQLLLFALQAQGLSAVSAAGHLGGALVGLIAYLWYRDEVPTR